MSVADQRTRDILLTQWDRVPAVRIDSPPGAGKTYVVVQLAVQAMEILGERCMIATQTNSQALDLVRRLATSYPRTMVHLFVRRDLEVPDNVRCLANVNAISTERDLPSGPCIVVATAHKWIWVRNAQAFDVLIVDEAFQLPDFRFHQLAGFALRVVLVGDPGQIPPIVNCDTEQWRSEPGGPHVAAPIALSHRRDDVVRLQLPQSRRLVQDTVGFVQPAFYPDLPFQSAAGPRDRLLDTIPLLGEPVDPAIDAATAGKSLVMLELPEFHTGHGDPEAARAIVALISRLIEREASISEDGEMRRLEAADIGVACAHVTEVTAVVELLPESLTGVLVETADRFQGLERDVMIVHHPLSGRINATPFHVDPGRFCVMLSRHRVACFIVARAGIDDVLNSYQQRADRALGIDHDAEFLGWQAHRTLLDRLQLEGRIFPIVAPSGPL